MDDVLEETLSYLRFHLHPGWGDKEPFDVFNRLLAKRLQPKGWTNHSHLDIKPHEISSHRETRTTDQLARLPRDHERARPLNAKCPIIVAIYGGRELLLDGTTRINMWIGQVDKAAHDVNVHVISDRNTEIQS